MPITATQAWLELGQKLIEDGKTIAPRGISTKERLFADVSFNMNYPVVYHQDRKLNYSFAAAEAYAITHGIPDANFLVRYNKNMEQFSDDGFIFNGAYGPPFANQVMYVVNNLSRDPNSRQAVLTIWRQNPITSSDIMCTIALQFLIRGGQIHAKVTMRSSDVWLGIPYDFLNFTLMTLKVLTLYNKLNEEDVTLGAMNWSAGSSHVYEHDIEKLEKVLSTGVDKPNFPVPDRAMWDWRYVTNSLHACMNKDNDAIENYSLWRIRP